jgi:hypothetical protein
MKRAIFFLMLLVLGLPGMVQAAHSVTLTFTASVDSSASIGYNVYRGTTSGGEGSTPLNSSPIDVNCSGTTCTYTDTAVSPGVTYYYILKATNTSTGILSIASNEASATVPIAPPTGLSATAQ